MNNIFVFLAYILWIASVNSSIDEQEVDAVINKALECHKQNPGLTVAIVKDGKTALAKGYGVIDLVTKRPVTNTTIFQLASMSKAFAATLLMEQLHQNKTLNIYTHVADILGHNFQFSTDIRTKYANLRDLLSHSLGIARNNPMRFDPTLTRKTLPSRVKYLNSIHPFRESFLYNNLMYGLVTRISEILGGGKAWEDLINEVIYQPLGMTSSNFATRIDPSRPDLAQGYTNDDSTGGVSEVPFEFNKKWSELCGSTCVMSNALDITKWMKFHLSGGKNEAGHQIVDANSLAYIYRPRNVIMSSTVGKYFTKPKVPVTTTETSYGFGWKIGYYKGYRILRHTGTTWGYSSLVTLIPDMNIGIFTSMTGQDHNYIFRSLLHNYLSDMALGETPWLNGSTICTFPEPWYSNPSTTHTSVNKNIPLYRSESEYIGSYANDGYGTLNITHNATLHTLEMTYGFARWALYPKHTHDTFYGEALGLVKKSFDLSTVKFHLGKTHHITSVEVTSFETNDPPVFQKHSHTPGSSSVFG